MCAVRFALVLAASLLAIGEAAAQVTFAPPANYATGGNPRDIGVTDLNGDGRPDLVVVDQQSDTISVFLGTGSGAFSARTPFAVGAQPLYIALGDFNGDGRIDAAVTNFTSGSLSILLGNGDGTFAAQTVIPGLAQPLGIVTRDFNGDGRLDLAVVRGAAVSILLGNGDGTFAVPVSYATGSTGPYLVAAADLNGDGRLDLAIAHSGSANVGILLGNGDGTFAAAQIYPTGNGAAGVSVADFNGDGKPDLAVSIRAANTIGILLGNGDGTFQPMTSMGTGAAPEDLASGDIDRDGKVDLVIASRGINTATVHTGNGDGTFSAPIGFAVGLAPFRPALADLDGDGRLDIVISNFTSNTISVLINTTLVIPAAPTGATATAGDAQVSVAFTTPTDAASLPIIDYTVDCGGITAVGASSPIVVTGLTNGVAYTCTVTARNATGSSPASAPSNSVTPRFVTSAALVTSASPVTVGTPVTFTATVTGGTPAGTVNFKDGGTTITGCGAVALAAGSAQCVASFATSGTKLITADYSSNVAHAPSTGVLAGGQVITAAQNSFTGPTATGTGSATISFTGGGATCSFAPQGNGPMQSAFFIPLTGHPKSPPSGSAPGGVIFPQGLLDFVLVNCTPGATMSFTITYPSAIAPTSTYWKYGPTTATPAPHWYALPATIVGNVVTFSITDGGLGDDDLAANGTVVDQGGPGFPPGVDTRQVPTLSEWMLALLAVLMFSAGAYRKRTQ